MSDISKGNNMGTAQNDNAQASAPPVDHIVTTEHSAVIRGQALDYTATTGTMVVETAGKKCEIFFTAYTMDEDESTAGRASSARRSGAANRSGASDRPLTFVFNGGPGSSSEWMHMGFFGPRRIACDDNGEATQFPIVIEDNEYSILDITDLVFIDPVGTGYSKPLEGAELAHFIGWKARSWRTLSAMIMTIGQWVISSGCMSQGMAAGVRQNISPASPTARSARLDWASICLRNTRWD